MDYKMELESCRSQIAVKSARCATRSGPQPCAASRRASLCPSATPSCPGSPWGGSRRCTRCSATGPGREQRFRVSAHAERFQQNLCATLRSLRFDAATQLPRPSPPSPGSVLPPPMPDVLQYWRRSGKVEREKSGRDPGSPRAEGA